MIETSQLQTLVAVSKCRSFSKAALELGVTQSAISQSIKSLENKVQVTLFKRSGKNVVPTTEGEKLCRMAKDLLLKVEETVDEIQFDKNTMSGRIRVGTLTGIGKSWLASRMLQFAKKFPELSLYVHLGFPQELAAEFEKFYLDCLILPEHDLPASGERVLFGEEYINLVLPNHPDFHFEGPLDLKTLSSFPIIAFEHDDSLFVQWCRKHFHGVPPQIKRRFVVNSHGNMLQAVSEGLGVAVVPTHVLKRSYYKDKVLTLGKEFEVFSNRFYFVYHKENQDLLRIKTFLEDILEEVKDPNHGKIL